MKFQLLLFKGLLEVVKEQSTKQAGQNPNRKKETHSAGNPAAAVDRQTAAGNDAMQVWMVQESLAPSVEHCKETDLGTEVFWVSRNASQSLAGRTKEDVVDHLLIVEREVSELVGNGEHHVKVVDWQKVRALLIEPIGFG